MTALLIRAQVELDQRHELMQMCRSWLSNQLPSGCLERRLYEDVMAPTQLLLAEEWPDQEAVNSYLSSEGFRALIGAIKVLGQLVDVRISESKVIEAGSGESRGTKKDEYCN